MFLIEVFRNGEWGVFPDGGHTTWVAAHSVGEALEQRENVLTRVIDCRPPAPGMVRGFYVTLVDGARVCWALGPFRSHHAALDAVKAVADRIYGLVPESHFWARGTASKMMANWADLPAGRLNDDASVNWLLPQNGIPQ